MKHSLSKELQRPVNQPGIPAEPTEEEVREHNMTHIPFKPWCELCIAHKSRQDKHHRESHTSSEQSVVSFDFGYADRGTDETLIMLCIHDRHTKMMHAVPTPSKGGRSLPYLSAELCRFVTWLGYQEVCLRTDNEPAALSLLEACRKALKGLGVHTTVELVVPGNKEANGAAEVTVQTIRNQANLLIEQIDKSVEPPTRCFSVQLTHSMLGLWFMPVGCIVDLQFPTVRLHMRDPLERNIMVVFAFLERHAWVS